MTSDSDNIGFALRMKGVSKSYPGTLAVNSVDFEARVGEVHALMGENGAGKSTLMQLVPGSFTDSPGSFFIGQKKADLHSPAMIFISVDLPAPFSPIRA